jgi:hypothetical protein
MSRSRFAQVARQRAEQQVRLVDPATLARAVDQNIEAQAFCFWARLCIYAYGRITPVLQSYLDERCPGCVDSARGQEYRNVDAVSFWHMLQEWIEAHGRSLVGRFPVDRLALSIEPPDHMRSVAERNPSIQVLVNRDRAIGQCAAKA